MTSCWYMPSRSAMLATSMPRAYILPTASCASARRRLEAAGANAC
eukprot:CAMPEP_0168398220 /NCGR_PEP_ID=MMETSP0228-20121227/21466_1 /TAXON_ID=133427 /ORGANISM="Protoceratium reticulatum, Strain CCCM 535 (=CCMP 1889)" /LENGTH=44 /DNA_ID= /DNA_START= /DNA_END= /DNA_ORIENTATION=